MYDLKSYMVTDISNRRIVSMTDNVQPAQSKVVCFEKFSLARKRKVSGQAYNRASALVLSGDCDPEYVKLFATAQSERDRAMAISMLMTESEMDAWSDVLEASLEKK
jgi:hypothetical protein